MIFLTRKETFNAAHRLFRPEWSDEKNEEVFGKCSNPNWHGHNYTLFVTVKGNPNPLTSFVINLHDLGEIIRIHIINKLDHKNINLDVEFMQGKMSSAEVLAVSIWEQLDPLINTTGCLLHCIKIQETEKNFVEYFGNL